MNYSEGSQGFQGVALADTTQWGKDRPVTGDKKTPEPWTHFSQDSYPFTDWGLLERCSFQGRLSLFGVEDRSLYVNFLARCRCKVARMRFGGENYYIIIPLKY